MKHDQIGEYEIPVEVLEKASAINHGMGISDGRTKGAKYVKQWCLNLDATKETVEALTRYLNNEIK